MNWENLDDSKNDTVDDMEFVIKIKDGIFETGLLAEGQINGGDCLSVLSAGLWVIITKLAEQADVPVMVVYDQLITIMAITKARVDIMMEEEY